MERKPRRMFRIRYSRLRAAAAVYLALPLIIFLIGFLKWFFALPGICAIGYAFFRFLKPKEKEIRNERTIHLSGWTIAGVFLLMLAWTQLGGMNGYLYQASDWAARNAVFRDLITHSWPVTYQNGSTALVYYIGHWLPAAVIGKAAGQIFRSTEAAWFCGRMALWIWSSLGLTLLSVLVFLFTGAEDRRKRTIVLLVMIFFSGMDIIGTWLTHRQEYNFSAEIMHLEWWTHLQFTSVTSCLYWAFNQAIVPWILTVLVLMDDDPGNYVFYIAAGLICAPMPAVGLCLLMAGKAIQFLVGKHRTKALTAGIRQVFSISNLLVLPTCIPVMAAYYLCNSVARDSGAAEVGEPGSPIVSGIKFLVFFMVEIGLVLLLLWPVYRKDILFYTVGISLLLVPFVRIGFGSDFCMRASIPAIFLTAVYAANVLSHTEWKKKEKALPIKYSPTGRMLAIMLAVVLFIGAATPMMEIYRGIYHVVSKGDFSQPCDTTYSFEYDAYNSTFTAKGYGEQFFFRTLAK